MADPDAARAAIYVQYDGASVHVGEGDDGACVAAGLSLAVAERSKAALDAWAARLVAAERARCVAACARVEAEEGAHATNAHEAHDAPGAWSCEQRSLGASACVAALRALAADAGDGAADGGGHG